MNQSPQQISAKAERLTDAFQRFNQLSENLSHSYQELQLKVAGLTQQLAVARTARVKTLMEKEKLADRLQQLLAALPAGVIVLNQVEQIIDCNQMAIDFLAEPLIGENWSEITQRSMMHVVDNPHERQLLNGQRISMTRSYLNHDAGQIILLSDVSELEQLQDQLNQKKHLSAMGEMVASMAHQVRTPLSTAILYASQMNKPAVSETSRIKFSGKILERLHYLERQVNDMLVFAKEGRLTMEAFSLATLLFRIEESMAETSAKQRVDFELMNQVTVDEMLGNEDALFGALVNILNNAVEASHGVGKISMSVTQLSESTISIQIIDNGSGMDERTLERLFEPFFTTKVKGTGLGLAVVDSVIRAHSGSIKCESEMHQETRFTITLPCVNQYKTALSSHSQPISRIENETV